MYGRPCFYAMTIQEKDEWRKKISQPGKKNGMFGKHQSDHAKALISKATKDKHWFNDGIKNVLSYSCPPGYKQGRLKTAGGERTGADAGAEQT